jgi:fucose permease
MAKTYENYPTLIAPTGTMAGRVLSKWLFNRILKSKYIFLKEL